MSESVGMKELVVALDQEFEELRRDPEADRTDRRGGKCFRRRNARAHGAYTARRDITQSLGTGGKGGGRRRRWRRTVTTGLAAGDGAHGDRGEHDQGSDREDDDQGGNREFRLRHRGVLRHPITQTCLDRP